MFSYLANGVRSWWSVFRFVLYFFSIGPLIRTLFSGWHRDTAAEREAWWERLILGTFITFLGLVIRLVVIAFGLFMLLCSVPLLPLLIIFPLRFSYESLVKNGSIGRTWSYGTSYALHKFGKPLYEGRDQKLYGREETLESITRVLSRGEKDNVLLVGAPGSGKETILQQFAKNVYRGLVPPKLKDRQVIEVPIAGATLGTVKRMFGEARKAGNLILVLHEPERFDGIFDDLLPLFSAPELQIIIVTTYEGYHSFWKLHTELLRYFEKLEVAPLGSAATLELVTDMVRTRYPKIRFEQGTLEEIVRRTDELVPQLPQPEKSLQLLSDLVVDKKEVSVHDVQALISAQTGVPVGTLARNEKEILLNLEQLLKTEIVGQDEAVRAIASALRRARTGIASKAKPIGSFLFLGPTGSGKTHTAQMLAKHYFGGSGVMVRFDMSEFPTEDTVAPFIERLSLSIEQNPFGLLFFDELEKANRAIWNTLLQVLDEGRLTTREGRTVSFKNTIIIATSNAGTVMIQEHPETTKDSLTKYLIENGLFAPEFLNRFDDVVVFHPLTQDDVFGVTKLLLADLNNRLMQEKGVTVQITDDLVARITAAGFDPQNGARALRRAVQDKIENAVAEKILRDEAPPGSVITLENI